MPTLRSNAIYFTTIKPHSGNIKNCNRAPINNALTFRSCAANMCISTVAVIPNTRENSSTLHAISVKETMILLSASPRDRVLILLLRGRVGCVWRCCSQAGCVGRKFYWRLPLTLTLLVFDELLYPRCPMRSETYSAIQEEKVNPIVIQSFYGRRQKRSRWELNEAGDDRRRTPFRRNNMMQWNGVSYS